MARRIRWQILIAVVSSVLVLGLMSYLTLTATTVARPLAGGAYVEGLTSPPQQLNPLVSDVTQDPSGADIQALVFEGLMRIGSDGLPEPALAQKWEMNEAGTVYTFTLRADVAWQRSDIALTADDVLFTVRAIQSPAFTGDPNIAQVWQNVLIDRVDDRTIRCTLRSPLASFLSLATFPILPAHLLRDLPPSEWATGAFSQKPIGTGPYQLDELTAEHALLSANPHYYGAKPFLERIELRFFASPAAAHAALIRGEIKGMGFLRTSEIGQMNQPRNIVRHTIALDSYTILTFNLRDGPLADQRFRRALAEGLDKDALIAGALKGEVSRLDTPILPGWWAAAQDITWYPYQQQSAADTLTALGYLPQGDGIRAKDGQALTLPLLTSNVPDRVAVAENIAQQWRALGIAVEVQKVDDTELQRHLDKHEFTLALHGWQRVGADPDVFALWHSSQATSGNNYAGLHDEQIDTLLEQARKDSDIVSRTAAYTAFQHRWVELAPSLTLYQPLYVYATANDLGGLGFDQTADSGSDTVNSQLLLGYEDRFRNVTRWFIQSAREIRGDLRQSP